MMAIGRAWIAIACFFVFAGWLVGIGEGIKWLSLQHSHLNWNISSMNNNHGRGIRSGVRSPCTQARRRYGLVKIQAKLCRTSMETMPHIQNAATVASDTCRKVFSDRRWNCSSIVTAPFLTPDLTRATREQAYVYAISSAALTYTLARACSSGNLHHCTCAGRPTSPTAESFQWGGCGDNVRWASQFAKRFIDNVEKHSLVKKDKSKRAKDGPREERSIQNDDAAVVNLHNNRVGRKVFGRSANAMECPDPATSRPAGKRCPPCPKSGSSCCRSTPLPKKSPRPWWTGCKCKWARKWPLLSSWFTCPSLRTIAPRTRNWAVLEPLEGIATCRPPAWTVAGFCAADAATAQWSRRKSSVASANFTIAAM